MTFVKPIMLKLASIAVALFATVALLSGSQPAAARSVEWTRYDVHLEVREDGSVDVFEYQEIEFTDGPFTSGFATIPLDRVDSIENVRISAVNGDSLEPFRLVPASEYDGDPGTYMVERSASDVYIEWGFESATNETRTFLLQYQANGVIRVYPDEEPPNQQIWWTAIGSEVTDIANVEQATVSIRLPQPVPQEDTVYGSEGADLENEVIADQVWTWTYPDMETGDDLTVRLQFPPITAAVTPTWQMRDDDRRQSEAEREERSDLYNLLFLGIAALGTVGGSIGLYGLWYARGRDPYAAEAASFIAEPPDDLPPGAAGVLLDEVANDSDLIATLLDLAHRGILTLEEKGKSGLFGARDYTLTLVEAPGGLRPFETEMLKAIFGPTLEAGEKTDFSGIKTRFAAASAMIKDRLYDEVVKRGYFDVAPELTRSRWKSVGTTALAITAVGGFLLIGWLASDAPAFWLVFVVALALAGVVFWMSRHMPRKTLKGAEAASKWNAFKRYLDDIERYEELGQHTEIFDRYLAYATAFGIENSWVNKFAQVNAPSPGWYGDGEGGGIPGLPGGRRWRGGRGPVVVWTGGDQGRPGGGGSGGAGGGPGMPNMPDLQDMSDSASRSLSSSSDGLFGMLESAAEAFSGWGSSGGGGRGGGWGGGFSGGGGGFRGGGGGGGSSGGGSRGFR